MKFEYFNGREPVSNCFITLPKVLQHDPELKKLSSNAKILYGIMLDRMKLSAINNQIDKDGKTFIYFSIESIQEELNVGRNTAFKVLEELDTDNGIGLIERVKCGQGRQSRIYVMRIVEANYDYTAEEYDNEEIVPVQKFNNRDSEEKTEVSESQNLNFKKFKNGTSRSLNSNTLEVYNPDPNKNIINKNKINNNLIHIYPSNTKDSPIDGMGCDIDETATRLYVREDMGTDHICEMYPAKSEKIRELENLIVDVLTTKRPKIHVGGEERDANAVKGQFMKLKEFHLETVLGNWSNLKKTPQNPRAYLLTMLYNAVGTAHMQFEAECNEGAQSNYQQVAGDNSAACEEFMEG